eukprot:15462111-Alexandrium_andersonii.AAC.1
MIACARVRAPAQVPIGSSDPPLLASCTSAMNGPVNEALPSWDEQTCVSRQPWDVPQWASDVLGHCE